MRDYTRAKSFALSIIVNILLLLAVAVFIVPKIIQYQEEQLYVIDLESDWEPDNGGGHAGGGGGGNLFPDKLSDEDMAKRINQVVQAQSTAVTPVSDAPEDAVNVPEASATGDKNSSSSSQGGSQSGSGPGTGGGSGGGHGGGHGTGEGNGSGYGDGSGDGTGTGEAAHEPFDTEGFRQAIEANKVYPPMATRRRLEGYATIESTIETSGAVSSVSAVDSTDSLFAQAAVAAAYAVGSYPNPTGETMHVTTTVRFELIE
ncbi:TonB family protein [Colibacter massiliensis]|uniref:TonB family protein n=1 Tax=Colibacter massiliensis TaxID=1852379 RepID=UPI003F92014A